MTRKDYELIAGALRVARESVSGNKEAEAALDLASNLMADRLTPTNAAFDRARFIIKTGAKLTDKKGSTIC